MKKETETIDRLIAQVVHDMELTPAGSTEYAALLAQLDQLYKTRAQLAKPSITPDTMLIVGGNILGILVIVSYEHLHVITSKALGFILKARI